MVHRPTDTSLLAISVLLSLYLSKTSDPACDLVIANVTDLKGSSLQPAHNVTDLKGSSLQPVGCMMTFARARLRELFNGNTDSLLSSLPCDSRLVMPSETWSLVLEGIFPFSTWTPCGVIPSTVTDLVIPTFSKCVYCF
jgi:hypothetical protein